jgi:hypothetical protein
MPDHVELTMSFDALYECRIPWRAIERVMFLPAAAPPAKEEPDDVPDDGKSDDAPFLRLVT